MRECDYCQHVEVCCWRKELDERGCNFFDDGNRWIPVSERMPEEDGIYLATCDGEICGEDEPFSGLAEFENGQWVDDEEDYQCVLAWMPLPEPYRGTNEAE